MGLFLFFALNLIVMPKLAGYQYGSLILFLGSLTFLAFNWKNERAYQPNKAWICTLLYYFIVMLLGLLLGDEVKDVLDEAYPFLFAIPIFYYVSRFTLPIDRIYHLNLLGSLLLLVACLAYRLTLDGHADARVANTMGMISIQFACIVMVMAVINLSAVAFYVQQKKQMLVFFAACAYTMTALLVLFSTARGSFLSLLVTLVIFVVCFYRKLPKKLLLTSGISVVVLMVTLLSVTSIRSSVLDKLRVSEAVTDFEQADKGNDNTSIGLRFVMWENALKLIEEKPLFGWGEEGYQTGMAALAAQNIDVSSFSHAHNDVLSMAVKKGLVGLLALLMLYAIPLVYFFKQYSQNQQDAKIQTIAFAGMMAVLSFVLAGLTQTIFAHNSGRLYYCMVVTILWIAANGAVANKGQCDS